MERSHADSRASAHAHARASTSADSFPAELTEQFRQLLSTRRINELHARSAQSRPSSPAPRDPASPQPPPAPAPNAPPPYSSLRNIPLVPHPPQDPRSLRFRNLLLAISHLPKTWENPGLLDEALRVVPLEQIYDEAEDERALLQAQADSLGPGHKPAWSYHDCVVRALMGWFRSFFKWINHPPCSRCLSATVGIGMAALTPDEQARGATQVESFQCSNPQCKAFERFPRYNDAFVLLQTRRGRAGEWATCFGMLCRAVGSRVRWVWNSEDHVWIEVYSEFKRRWIHIDVAEGAWDKPLLYTEGWGRKLAYCIAFSADGAKDVTRRYVRNPYKNAANRNRAPEAVVLHIVNEVRAMRRRDMSKEERFRLQGEDMAEEREFRHYFTTAISREICNITVEEVLAGHQIHNPRPDPDVQKASEALAAREALRRGTSGHSSGPNSNGPNPPGQQGPRGPGNQPR